MHIQGQYNFLTGFRTVCIDVTHTQGDLLKPKNLNYHCSLRVMVMVHVRRILCDVYTI